MRTPAERAELTWIRYVSSIPTAVIRFAASPNKPTAAQIEKYKLGMERYARILEREARSFTKGKR